MVKTKKTGPKKRKKSSSIKASKDKKEKETTTKKTKEKEKDTKKKVVKKKITKKRAVKKEKVKKEIKRPAKRAKKGPKYWEGIGRRKTAIARVRIFTQGDKEFLVNEKKVINYFPISYLIKIAASPLETLNLKEKFKVSAKTTGGGSTSQAEAVRHGLARALIKFNPNFRKKLKKAGFLTRDPRMKERKKFGLKRARRAPQWRKR